MSDSKGEGDFVHYGTPLTAPEEVPRRHEFQKTEVRDEATVQQNLPVWKQVPPQSPPIIRHPELVQAVPQKTRPSGQVSRLQS